MSYPTTLDMSLSSATAKEHMGFINFQADIKVAAGRYSWEFGPDLLPGMYSSPVYTVSKLPDTMRLINHQYFGEYSLNLMIPKESMSGTCMDGVRSLCTALLCFH